MRDEENKAGFTVVDKRGANNPVQEKPKTEEQREADLPVQDRKWKSVGYRIDLRDSQQGPVISGIAAGLATDGNLFTAEWLFGPSWEPGFDWTVDATRRLNTFLQCPCTQKTGPCAYHRRMAPKGWAKEDIDRIREDSMRAAPEAIEVLFKAEQARQQAQQILTAQQVSKAKAALAPRR